MKKWLVFLVMVLAARLAAADEHVVYEYLSTCYKNTQGSWNAAYVQHEGRLFGNTPTLSISNDKKVVWVKAANFEGAFYYIETLPGGDRLYNYKEVGAPDPMFLALIYPEAAIAEGFCCGRVKACLQTRPKQKSSQSDCFRFVCGS